MNYGTNNGSNRLAPPRKRIFILEISPKLNKQGVCAKFTDCFDCAQAFGCSDPMELQTGTELRFRSLAGFLLGSRRTIEHWNRACQHS